MKNCRVHPTHWLISTQAEVLQALGCKLISECKEEMLFLLPDGRVITICTATCTYDPTGEDRAKLKTFIDGAEGPEELMKSQVGAFVFAIDFSNTENYTYKRQNTSKKTHVIPSPADGWMFCVLGSAISQESREALKRGVDVPKGALAWGLYRLNGRMLHKNWLKDHKPRHDWKGE